MTKRVFRAIPMLTVLALLLFLPVLAHAAPPAVTHELEVVEDTKALLSDLAAYGKYILPAVALAFYLWGSLNRIMAGDDDMKKARADRILGNAKVGLVLGLIAAPLLLWLEKYYA